MIQIKRIPSLFLREELVPIFFGMALSSEKSLKTEGLSIPKKTA
jgi:hypothetical protein